MLCNEGLESLETLMAASSCITGRQADRLAGADRHKVARSGEAAVGCVAVGSSFVSRLGGMLTD